MIIRFFYKTSAFLFFLLLCLSFTGCDDQQETQVTKTIRQETAAPPVEAPSTELLQSQKAFIEVSGKVTPAVVNISAERIRTLDRISPLFEEFFGDFFRTPQRERREKSLGSGFILNKEGFILTNEHVVSGAQEIKVRLTDNRVFPGKVIGVDPKTDVAVIKIDADEPLPSVVLGNSDHLQVGQWALAIGNPFGLDSTLTVGVISATGRTDIGIEDYENFIQTDASINPGNSGGPLLNIYGEVVGVNTAIVASGQGIGFAIPINLAMLISDQLITAGQVTRGWLGVSIQPLDADLAESFGLDRVTGALVTRVLPGTPADRAGLKRGDVLLTFDGKPVRSVKELQLLVASSALDQEIPMDVLRDGTRLMLQVKIVARDDDALSKSRVPDESDSSWLGMSFVAVDDAVRVSAVEPGSVASRGGVLENDQVLAVNRYAIGSLADLRRARQSSQVRKNVLLLLQRDQAKLYVALPVEE